MLMLHVGIALALSLKVGALFLTTLPCYLLGFSCEAPVGSAPWALAVAIGVLPSAACLAVGKLLPDEWPLTAVSLFMFDGEAARRIASDLMTGETRLVLATAELPPRHHLAGLRVVPHRLLRLGEIGDEIGDEIGGEVGDEIGGEVGGGAAQAGGRPAAAHVLVHDAVLRVISFTTVHADLHSLLSERAAQAAQAANAKGGDACGDLKEISLLVTELSAWLERDQRIVERATGLPLRRAYFVRVSVEDKGRILEVLCRPQDEPALLSA